jgi:hypothetical protein
MVRAAMAVASLCGRKNTLFRKKLAHDSPKHLIIGAARPCPLLPVPG